jgi:PTH2 family peptidyl-tRNA hydrolase
MKSKQVIVIRKDLNMRKGKMVAQGAHASMKVILDMMIKVPGEEEKILYYGEPGMESVKNWLEEKYTKICVSVNSEEELKEIYENAIKAGVPASIILDAGLTEFDGVPTYTAAAVGPGWDTEIDPITSHLKLL